MMKTTLTALALLLAFTMTSASRPITDPEGTVATADKPKVAKRTDRSANEPTIDPDAIAALKKMSAYLRTQQSFVVRTKAETDEVLDNGQKIQLATATTISVRKPNKLRADILSDRKQRQFFYDGATFTMNGQRIGYYATVLAPPTILELIDNARDKYGIELPLVDLFAWGTDAPSDPITAATNVGLATIDGVDTDHYALRQKGMDWQIWIQRGDKPVPRKMVLTSTDDPARPEHEVVMDWMLDAKLDDKVFAFVPPPKAHKIKILDVESIQAELKKANNAKAKQPDVAAQKQ